MCVPTTGVGVQLLIRKKGVRGKEVLSLSLCRYVPMQSVHTHERVCVCVCVGLVFYVCLNLCVLVSACVWLFVLDVCLELCVCVRVYSCVSVLSLYSWTTPQPIRTLVAGLEGMYAEILRLLGVDRDYMLPGSRRSVSSLSSVSQATGAGGRRRYRPAGGRSHRGAGGGSTREIK